MRVVRDRDYLRVSFPYNERLVNLLRPLGDFRKTPYKHWRFEATPWHAWMVHKLLANQSFTWDEASLALVHQQRVLEKKAHAVVGKKIEGLFPYQSACVNFIMAAKGRALIGDDVGLGKTVEALAWMNTRGDVWPAAVVSPASVVYKWHGEALKWLKPERSATIVEGYKGIIETAELYFMSYNVMAERVQELKERGLKLVVLDEAHYLKNHKAKRTLAAKELCLGVPFVLGLDGTPFLNRPIEMFNPLNIIDGKLWNNVWEYGNKYCGGRDMFGMFQGATNIDELRSRLEGTMIRRLKSEVADQLPPLTRAMLPVSLNRVEYDKVGRMTYPNRLARLTALYGAVGVAKVPPALEWATDFLEESDRKLVIFAYHIPVVAALVEQLERFGALYITGEVSQKQRADRIAKFQGNTTNRVMVINTAAVEGIDLYAASDILFVERLWVPSLEAQAEGRLHRNGQVNPVTAWYLVAKNTIDEKLARIVDSKRDTFAQVLDDNSIKKLVLDEM